MEPPPQHSRGEAQRAERMSDVVLAVPEGPFAILPGFSPVDGREPNEEGTLRKCARQRGPDERDDLCTTFEARFLWGVVVNARTRMDALHRWQHGISLRRVEVPARGIGAERPGRP